MPESLEIQCFLLLPLFLLCQPLLFLLFLLHYQRCSHLVQCVPLNCPSLLVALICFLFWGVAVLGRLRSTLVLRPSNLRLARLHVYYLLVRVPFGNDYHLLKHPFNLSTLVNSLLASSDYLVAGALCLVVNLPVCQ